MFKIYAQLTKLGIVIFVLISTIAGFALGFQHEIFIQSNQSAPLMLFLKLILGVYFLSSGSLALNQVQEIEIDKRMERTANRPLASGKITPAAALILSLAYIYAGLSLVSQISMNTFWLGVLTVALYNGVYTYYWKPRWIYAAVPGAIPGALPVSMGYVATGNSFYNKESIYLFLILFLWQMPHFWALALRFKDQYRSGGIPTLPTALGVRKTIFQMGIYTFIYVFMALFSPFVIHTGWFYLLFVLPVSAKVVHEFIRFQRSHGEKHWLSFFMWVNLSVIIYLIIPSLDKWSFLFIDRS